MTAQLRLGINIDHVATLRNARGGRHPDPLRAAQLAVESGADGITAHLREDRRHIRDDDIWALKRQLDVPLNMEVAATLDMVAMALEVKPHACCIVPERRRERTTEGGLDAASGRETLRPIVNAMVDAGIRVSLFIEPVIEQLDAARDVGAPAVELHTGRYSDLEGDARAAELGRIDAAAAHAAKIGLECHAGHGLNYDNVGPVAAIPSIVELNIGHYLVGDAIFVGFGESIRRMRACMDKARGARVEGRARA